MNKVPQIPKHIGHTDGRTRSVKFHKTPEKNNKSQEEKNNMRVQCAKSLTF